MGNRRVDVIRIVLAWAFVALAALPGKAASGVTDFMLDNGMQVVVIEDHRAPVVTHMVWYNVGSADEPPGKSGIAHFLEHLMFKGTKTLAPGEFSKTVAANGGTDNAFTSFDYTGYFQRVAADRLSLVMEMEADRMVNLVLTDDVVATERDVVIEERNTRVENSPGSKFSEQRRAAMFMNHRYGIPVIGWMHEIETLDREDALAFYKEHYAPNNAVLIVAGDVTPEEVRTLAERHYGVIPANPEIKPRARPQEPPQLSPRRLTYVDPRVRQPYVVRTYIAPTRGSGSAQEAAALTYLSELLGGSGYSSVFGQELQLNQKIAVSSGAFYDNLSLDPDLFGVYVVPVPGVSLEEAEEAMNAVLAKFMEEGPDPEHLDRIRAQIRANEIYALDNQHGRARRYGTGLTAGLTIQEIQDWPEVLQAVTEADIMAAAKRLFDARRSVTGYLMGGQEPGVTQ